MTLSRFAPDGEDRFADPIAQAGCAKPSAVSSPSASITATASQAAISLACISPTAIARWLPTLRRRRTMRIGVDIAGCWAQARLIAPFFRAVVDDENFRPVIGPRQSSFDVSHQRGGGFPIVANRHNDGEISQRLRRSGRIHS